MIKKLLCCLAFLFTERAFAGKVSDYAIIAHGLASWYGEEHRGKLMANGKPFDPDKLTAASWYYPLGTKLIVVHSKNQVRVTITDRGPNKRFKDRIIDLSAAAFGQLNHRGVGLLQVSIHKE